MSNTLGSFELSNILSSGNRTSSGSQTTHTSGVPEIYGYNVVSDQDHDILNQGSIKHIQKYFNDKQTEFETEKIMSHDATNGPLLDQPDQNYLMSTMGDNTFVAQRHVSPPRRPSDYSVNNTTFIIKFIIVIIFVWILWDFIDRK